MLMNKTRDNFARRAWERKAGPHRNKKWENKNKRRKIDHDYDQ